MVCRCSVAGLLTLLAALHLNAQIPGARTLNVIPADARYYQPTNRIYALLTADSPQYPQSVVEIDPGRLAILRVTPLPGTAHSLRVTDDGTYIYAYTRLAPCAAYRLRVATMSLDAIFYPTLSDSSPPSDTDIFDLLPISGQPQSYVATFADQWGNYTGAAVFDGANRRPKTLADLSSPVATLIPTPTANFIYEYNDVNPSWPITGINIAADGLEAAGKPFPGAAWKFQLELYNGLLYSSNGFVIGFETHTLNGWFCSSEMDASTAFVIDAPHGLIYFASRYDYGTAYLAYDLNTFLPVARLWHDNGANDPSGMPWSVRRMLLTNAGDLVVFDSSQSNLLFIPVSSLPKYTPWTPPAGAQTITQYLRFLPIPASYLSADQVNHTLLASLQGRVPGAGNSLMTIDPAAGSIVSNVFVGAEPTRPAASSGGLYSYVPLRGHGAIRRLRTVDRQSDLYVPLWGLPRSSVWRELLHAGDASSSASWLRRLVRRYSGGSA